MSTPASRPRPSRRKWLLAALAALRVVIALILGIGSLMDSPRQAAESRFRAIQPGMSRAEVRRLVQGGRGTIMYTGIATAELMHIDGKYLIAVDYQPAPGGPKVAGVPDDDWVAKDKVFVELGRGGPTDNLLVSLGLKSPRSAGRARLSR